MKRNYWYKMMKSFFIKKYIISHAMQYRTQKYFVNYLTNEKCVFGVRCQDLKFL